ncbi:MAG: hypothetical protein K6A68_09990 [Clostridiales bacterium]|jgi:hypothetical protein|nr:hypothetical protein [Clostridiales bacterium]
MSLHDLRDIVLLHVTRYPFMTCRDVLKLCYQREFGGGHMIRDPKDSLQNLVHEMETAHAGWPDYLMEDIGNGRARIYLGMAKLKGLSAEKINDVFVKSAACQTGSMLSFTECFPTILELAEQGVFQFSRKEMQDYLTEYCLQGCPMVSHSEEYRKLYRPAYRVLQLEVWNEEFKL